jgi:hypothetical protein
LQNNTEETARQYINWCNILLRYGKFENLITYFPKNYSGHYNLEIELIKETAKLETFLSQEKFITIDAFLELSERFLDDSNTNEQVLGVERAQKFHQMQPGLDLKYIGFSWYRSLVLIDFKKILIVCRYNK